jgi:hypothetical protein
MRRDAHIFLHAESLTLDNVSSNDVLARVIGRLMNARHQNAFHVDNAQIHCMAHVVNLVAQKILAVAEEVDDPDLKDYYEQFNKHLSVHYDADKDDDQRALEAEIGPNNQSGPDNPFSTPQDAQLAAEVNEAVEEERQSYKNMRAVQKVRCFSTSVNLRAPTLSSLASNCNSQDLWYPCSSPGLPREGQEGIWR